MANYRTSRIVPTVLTIVIIIIAIAGIVALARFLFGGGTSNGTETVDLSQQNLLSVADGRAVSMTARGPIVADEDFSSYRIIISPTARQFESFTGYLATSVSQQTLSNNTAAYDEFVHALDKANLVKGTPFEGDRNDVRGICATGKVYEFRLLNNGEPVEMLWTSTCSGSPGSLRANITQLSNLFFNQIPDGSNIESKLRI